MKECGHLAALTELVPSNCFVGKSEAVPGLEGEYFK